MITKEQIWDKTNGGRTIIESFYPMSREAFDNPRMKFRIRDEKTPSAAVKYIGNCWFVTDFGNDDKGRHAVQIVMDELGMDYERAVNYIAEHFNIDNRLSAETNKPRMEFYDATFEQKEGFVDFSFRESGFTEEEIHCMCPLASKEHLSALNWHPVEWILTVKNRKVIKKYSTDSFFIFMRECVYKDNGETKTFYKIYEPLNPEKQYRFRYTGEKPSSYINGLNELRLAYEKFNAGNEHPEKLDNAIICSGERDAVSIAAMGFNPIWFNSETHDVTSEDFHAISNYVKEIYNVPDLDETGIRQGRKLALDFMDIHTIWLPDSLKKYKDNRGRPRKDLRDWMDIVGRKAKGEFIVMMNNADPAKFWYWTDNGWQLKKVFVLNFLQLHGFARLYDKDRQQNIFIKIEGNVVTKQNIEDLRYFLVKWSQDAGLKSDIREKIVGSRAVGEDILKTLKPIELDFSSADDKRQLFFFKNMSVEVSADGYVEYKGNKSSSLQHYVWDNAIVKHDVRLLDPFFCITWHRDDKGKTVFNINILSLKSKYFCYLINTSRLYWRKEMEERFQTDEERKAYKASHPFCIDGEGLTDEEIEEQKLNLINKLFAIGYLAYKYKEADRAYAPLCMDYKIGDVNQSNGGSGKSIFGNFFKNFMNVETKNGKDTELLKDKHVWATVNKYTDIVFVDDLLRNVKLDHYYNLITQDMTINPKGKDHVTLPFIESPKFLLTTNFVPSDSDPSSVRRLLYVNFSDYYHQATDKNNYLESRTVGSDFGKQLFGHLYTDDEWNADMNLVMQCVRFYLSVRSEVYKIDPPMANIYIRAKRAAIGQDFLDWADETFMDYEENPNLDHFVKRAELFSSFMQSSNMDRTKASQFRKKLLLYCEICEWIEELNPDDVCGKDGRIIKKEMNVSTEFYFIRSKRAAEIIRKRKEEKDLQKMNDENVLFTEDDDED